MPIVTIVGAAISIGAGIWKKSKAKKALHDGKNKEQLLLILRYQYYVMGDTSTLDYGKMNGQLYLAATDFWTGYLGLEVEDNQDLEAIWHTNYHMIKNKKWFGLITMEQLERANRILKQNRTASGADKTYGDWGKRPWKPSDIQRILDQNTPPVVQQPSSLLTIEKTASMNPNNTDVAYDDLIPAGIIARVENPLKTYWWAFLLPVVILLGVLLKRLKRA